MGCENMKNRVKYQEYILESIGRIPFLKKFLWDKDTDRNDMQCPYFDPDKINKYMGYHWTKDKKLSSKNMNEILEEAERRGDL